MGSGAFFSEDYGAGNQKKLKEDIGLSFWFILSVSVVICAIIYPGMNFILWILQTPKEFNGTDKRICHSGFCRNYFCISV